MFHVKHPYVMGRARIMTKKLLMGNEAFAHAALEAGVRVVAGYPGTPSSELIETVAKLHADGAARGIHVEWSTNEKSALELLAGASYTGARCLFTCKQVGLNVASDALMSLNYVGVKGGMVLFVADDPGPISSQTEQDTRRFASFAKLPVLDPATPDQGFAMMQAAFDLSERYHTPVIVRPTTRINHASTFFDVADATDARPVPDEGFERNPKWVIFPRRAYQAHGEINERLAAIAHDFAVEPALAAFNPMVEGGSQPRGDARTNVSRETFDDGSVSKTATSAGAKAVGIGAGASDSAASAVAPRLGIVAGGVSAAYAREALRMVEARAGKTPAVLCGDIGCYTLGNAMPLDAVDTCLCMGAGITMAQGFAVAEPHKKTLAFVGDSTFFASGLPGLVNAVYNGHDITVCVLDNATTAMTGSQPHPGTGVTLMGPKRQPISIPRVLEAVGFDCIVHANPLDLDASVAAVREALDHEGPSAVLFESPCIQLVKPDAPAVVDAETCTGCKKCITEIGCPGIGFDADARGPRSKQRGQAFVDPGLCNGCGLCVQVCPFDALSMTEPQTDVSRETSSDASGSEGGCHA